MFWKLGGNCVIKWGGVHSVSFGFFAHTYTCIHMYTEAHFFCKLVQVGVVFMSPICAKCGLIDCLCNAE